MKSAFASSTIPASEGISQAPIVGRSKGAVSIQIAQAAPPPNADTLGYDRVLILSFDQPIDSGSVTTHVLDRAAD